MFEGAIIDRPVGGAIGGLGRIGIFVKSGTMWIMVSDNLGDR